MRRTIHRTPAVVAGLGMTGLGVVRSLRRHGVPTLAVDALPAKESGRTRLCRKRFFDAHRGETLWESLDRLPPEWSDTPPVLFFTRDTIVVEASARRESLARRFRFTLPDSGVVRALMDKTAFAAFAMQHGLPVPRTFAIRGRDGWEQVRREAAFPCLVKPKYRTEAWARAGLPKVFSADTPDSLRSLLETLGNVEQDYVVQEWIPGPDSEVYFHLVYCDEAGRPASSFTGRKLRQWPPLLGSTTVAEPARCEEVAREAARLFEAARFRGLGSVEFKRDPRDRRFKIIEATVGRPNLQSEVATANGVNLAYYAYCDWAKETPESLPASPRPVRWVYLDNDLSSALHYLRRRELTWRQYLCSYRPPLYFADFSWCDPGPFLFIVLRWTRNLFARAISAMSGRRGRPTPRAPGAAGRGDEAP